MGRKVIDRIGEFNYNNNGNKMEIVECISSNNIKVMFENGYIKNTSYKDFKNGSVKSPYDRTVYGVGYLGEGERYTSLNGKPSVVYKSWNHMLERCYDDKYKQKYPTYNDSCVDDYWHNFYNFILWHKCNYYKVENERMCLDKDILTKGNKIYSEKNCIYVPNNINVLFTKSNSLRGELPIGVTYHKKSNKYRSQCNIFTNGKYKRKHIGLYENVEDAFNSYKHIKEKVIKDVAEYYKTQIPKKLYNAMYNYEVEITD